MAFIRLTSEYLVISPFLSATMTAYTCHVKAARDSWALLWPCFRKASKSSFMPWIVPGACFTTCLHILTCRLSMSSLCWYWLISFCILCTKPPRSFDSQWDASAKSFSTRINLANIELSFSLSSNWLRSNSSGLRTESRTQSASGTFWTLRTNVAGASVFLLLACTMAVERCSACLFLSIFF